MRFYENYGTPQLYLLELLLLFSGKTEIETQLQTLPPSPAPPTPLWPHQPKGLSTCAFSGWEICCDTYHRCFLALSCCVIVTADPDKTKNSHQAWFSATRDSRLWDPASKFEITWNWQARAAEAQVPALCLQRHLFTDAFQHRCFFLPLLNDPSLEIKNNQAARGERRLAFRWRRNQTAEIERKWQKLRKLMGKGIKSLDMDVKI